MLNLIGQPLDRVDGMLKVTGRALFIGDVLLPRLAHASLVLSTIPKGRIVAIDTAAASSMPGVLLVLTHANAMSLPQGGRAAVKPPAGRVLNLLQDDVVHYNRQPVAVVVAESLQQAAAAATAVRVHYAETPAQLDFEAARAAAHSPGHINRDEADSHRGADPVPQAAATIAAVYTTPMEHHNPMEPHATVAHWQGEQLTLYDTTQYISGDQETVAKTLGIPKDNVRVVCPYVGGGFGCKGSVWSHVVLTVMAAKQLGRPVKLVLERPQMFGPVGGRPRTEQHLTLAADPAGRFISTVHDVFSHTSEIEDFAEGSAIQTRMLYACPNVDTTHRVVPLNVGTPTFQRAPGESTGTFALETAVDELAYALQIDPVELRMRNEPPIDPQKRLPWSSRSLRECYRSGAEAFGWSRRNPAPRSMRDGKSLVGWGVASATYPANRSPAHATARITPDGVVVVQSGTQDLGTGTYTVMTQIAAETLGFPVERVHFELGDSNFPQAPVSGGSQSVASVAPAVQAAAQALREKLIAMAMLDEASPVFRAPTQDIVIDNGNIGRRSASRREPLAATVVRSGERAIEVTAEAQPGAERQAYSFHSFGAVFAEVNVDRDLGMIVVPRIVARYGVGRLMNAKTGHSQLMGGVVWGLGMGLMEESVLGRPSGRIVNANLAEYHVPTNADVRTLDIETVAEEDWHVDPLGAKGVGEIGITGVAAALSNAVYHATGVRVRELPITLDKVLHAAG